MCLFIRDGRELTCSGQRILRAVGQCNRHLIRLLHVQRGIAVARDRRAVQHKFHCIGLFRVHDHLPVGKRTGQQIGAAVGDGHRVARHLNRGR